MVDIAYLKKRGVSSEAYKAIFTQDEADRPPKITELINLIADRIRDGRDSNLRDYRPYAAIDLAFDVPFNQTTPTIVQSIISRKLNYKETVELLKAWGLSLDELFLEVDVGNGQKGLVPNPPVFWQVLVPLVKAYTTIRVAKLFNDRNQTPLLPFFPIKQTPEKRVICEIVTDLIESISTLYGYSAVLREAILHAVKYGIALSFPREEWHVDEQFVGNGVKPDRYVVKEGLRYVFPHPTRMFYDLNYPLTTINTDSGTTFAGHWRLCRYGDILGTRAYWNKEKIPFGPQWYNSPAAQNYFREVYPCTMRFPSVASSAIETREDRAALYTSNDRDAAVFVCDVFMKIVPSDWGLADYRFPVWHRFTMASDAVVLWAGPCAYTPMWMMGYDYDSQSARQSSFALEAIPWQDQIGNLLSQMILTSKQNLANLIYYDTNLVDRKDIERLENIGERKYRSMNFVPFDSLRLQRHGLDARQAFHPIQFQYRDVSQLAQTMGATLNMLERIMQMSAQEVGAAAQHYQSAKEILVTQNATTNRLAYTGSFIDDGIDAWKRQLYEAAMAYMDTDILAQINPGNIPGLQKVLKDLGFEANFDESGKVVVKGKKDSLRIEGFARNDNVQYRESDVQLAQVIYQTVGAITNNPELFNMVGADNILMLLEEAAKLSGAPNSFKLRFQNGGKGSGGILEQVKALLAQQQQGIMQFVQKQIAEPSAQIAAQSDARLDQLEAVVKQLSNIYRVVQQQTDKNAVAAAKAAQDMQLKQAEFEAEQARKQQAHELAMQQKMEAATVSLQAKQAQAAVSAQAKAEQADAAAKAKLVQAAAAAGALLQKSDAQAEAIETKRQMERRRAEAAIENQKRAAEPKEPKV